MIAAIIRYSQFNVVSDSELVWVSILIALAAAIAVMGIFTTGKSED